MFVTLAIWHLKIWPQSYYIVAPDCMCVSAVTVMSDVLTVKFNVAAKSRDSYPWRVELVFESPSPMSSRYRGRAKVSVCHSLGDETSCRISRRVRYRRYSGPGTRYSVYDVTAAILPVWAFCHAKPCRLDLEQIFVLILGHIHCRLNR